MASAAGAAVVSAAVAVTTAAVAVAAVAAGAAGAGAGVVVVVDTGHSTAVFEAVDMCTCAGEVLTASNLVQSPVSQCQSLKGLSYITRG